jgi:hypothetical protein
VLYVINPSRRAVERTEVDGCAITEGPRCDWMLALNDSTSAEEFYVELKGRDVARGVEQLEATIPQLSVEPRIFPKRSFVVFTRNPMIGTDVQKNKVTFRKTFNSTFELVKNNSEILI